MITITPLKDRRMNWMRSIDRLEGAQETYHENCELKSDCWIPGIGEYANGFLLCGGIAEMNKDGGQHSYILKLEYATGMEETIEAGRRGIDLWPSREIISLMSLHLHARFFLSSTTTDTLTSSGIPSRTHHKFIQGSYKFDDDSFVPDLFKDKGNLTTLASFLDEIRNIPDRYHRDLIYAIYNYADAIRWIGFDEKITYLKLIIAVEILAGDDEEIHDELNLELQNNKSRIPEELAKEVSEFQKQRRIKKSFIQFIMDHKTDFLGSRKKTDMYVTDENIDKYLAAIYNSRSNYIHEGRPMTISSLSHYDWDVSPGKTIRGTLETGENEQIPTAVFFESLVRHCLLQYIEKLRIPKPTKI
ncbi:MAG: hypothetical protein Q7S29_00300 [Candidatus Peribacter sp.]|nr:hypothetical protein [Candidatus Peribacter sp.]